MNQPPISDLRTVSVRKLASISGLSKRFICGLIAEGQIESIKAGRRRLILLEGWKSYLQSRRGPSASGQK